MISTKSSLLKRFADITEINTRFSKIEHNSIENDLEYMTSPVDATLFSHGDIDKNGYIISKHGKKVALDMLIGPYASKFQDGIYLNLYLSPKNKHYFVFPYDGKVEYIQKNEGKAFIPIIIGLDHILGNQKWFSKAAEKNASIGIVVNSGKFSYAMIAVGSLNVNNITVDCDTNKKYRKGTYAGHFAVGSTVILCLDKSLKDNSQILIKDKMETNIGQPIAKIQSIYKQSTL